MTQNSPTWDTGAYRALIDACYQADTTATKGQTLESLAEYAFSRIEGLVLLARDIRMGSQEIDLVFWNDQVADFFRAASAEILIECKNWESAVGSAEAAWFIEKMRQRAVSHGFLITRNGVTGEFRSGRDGALDTLYSTLREGMRPVVLTLEELEQVGGSTDLLDLFKTKVGNLLVRRL